MHLFFISHLFPLSSSTCFQLVTDSFCPILPHYLNSCINNKRDFLMSFVSSEKLELLKLLECVMYGNHSIFWSTNFEYLREPFFLGRLSLE